MIDCDMHIEVPGLKALGPYLSGHWNDSLQQRGVRDLQTYNYPPQMPLSVRKDWRKKDGQRPASTLADIRNDLLDPFGIDIAICNPTLGVQILHSEDLAAVLCRALNSYVYEEWLKPEPRLRASIVVPLQSPELAIEEIEHWAGVPQFVQILFLVSADQPLGKRRYWPIYQAAEKHDLPICVHAGSMFRYPTTASGLPTYYFENYAAQAGSFQSQLTSLVAEGVFQKYPGIKFVLAESGITWLPSLLTRLDKVWKGLRLEIPWVKESPSTLVHRNVRLTLQPFDAPDDGDSVKRLNRMIDAEDMLLFSTDYPHWQFDGMDVIPEGFDKDLIDRIARVNPLDTYSRLREPVSEATVRVS